MADYDVYGVGNALVDMEFEVSDETLDALDVDKGLMTLIDKERHDALMSSLSGKEGSRGSGGSAANTVIACAQLGGKTFYSCKVASDETGTFYMNDLTQCNVASNLTMDNREPGLTGKCRGISGTRTWCSQRSHRNQKSRQGCWRQNCSDPF